MTAAALFATAGLAIVYAVVNVALAVRTYVSSDVDRGRP